MEKIYAPPAYLPQLKGGKRSRSMHQISRLNSNIRHEKSSSMKERSKETLAFDRRSLFDEELSTFLTRFDHSAYAMIPAKLYKYEESTDTNEFQENSWADMFIPYNAPFTQLKNSIVDILFGKNTLDCISHEKAMKKLKVWSYFHLRKQWILLQTDSEWNHSKLSAQEQSDSLKLMYRIDYLPGVTSIDHGYSSIACSTRSTINDDLTISTEYTDFSPSKLDRLPCNTPNPPVKDSGVMHILQNDLLLKKQTHLMSSKPKEQGMANILESRLMKSRY